MYLSVIIPAYREATRITPTLEKVVAYLGAAPYDSEVLVIDDGSPDDTIVVVQRFITTTVLPSNVSLRLIALDSNLGKGGAVRKGMLEATGKIRIFTDADLSTPIKEVEKVFTAIETEGYDIAIGSRALEKELIKVHQPWYRETMGRFFNLLVQLMVFRGIKDTQCGFKGFTAKAAEKVFSAQKVMGFSFDVDILFLAKKFGYKIKEVPVEWYNDERTTVGALSDSSKMFFELLRIKRLHR